MFKFSLLLSILSFSILLFPEYVSGRNILLVTTDDMTSTIFDAYPKHSFFNSANIFNGISSQPVCGPARASLLTGLRPDTTRIYNFETYLHQPTMFSYFKGLGYDTFVSGKVFHTLPIDANKQFEYVIGELTNPRICLDADNNGCQKNEFYCSVKNSGDLCSINSIKSFFSSRIGKTTSWIAGVGFHRPHLELTIASKGHSNLCQTYVKDTNFQPPIVYQSGNQSTNFQNSLSNIQHTDLLYIKVPINGVYTKMNANGRTYPVNFFVQKYANTVQQMRQAYCDSSTETINFFLEIVDSMYQILPQSINNTDIIFIADHGFQIGQRGILGKNTLYPESTNIPLFFKIGGENTKRPIKTNYVSSIDVFPTLIQLHAKSVIRGSIPKLDGISLLNSGQIPISQYPRCQPLGSIQTDDCTVGSGPCSVGGGRSAITNMGYMTIQEINGVVYRFSEWFPFKENRVCGWPFWTGIPKQFVNYLGPWPVWNIQPTSGTDFSKTPVFKELYTIDQNTQLINSGNLINDNRYVSVVAQLDQVIKKSA